MARNASSTALALALLASAPAVILAYTDAEVDAKDSSYRYLPSFDVGAQGCYQLAYLTSNLSHGNMT